MEQPRRVEHQLTDKGYVPVYTTTVVEQPWNDYSATEHATWATLFQRQMALLPGRACDEFFDGLARLQMNALAIPRFADLNPILKAATGWELIAVEGLLPEVAFFEHLANRRFPAGNFIRGAQQLDYLQEPDIFHDGFGHVPMLMNPVMADFIQAYGAGGLRAERLGVLPLLARVYWYTVEFGLVRQHGGLRLFGAGIPSSYTESLFCLDDPSPNRLRFELERVMRTDYRIDDFQETYFVLDSLDDLLHLAQVDFAPLYDRLHHQPSLPPGKVLPHDHIWHRGNGAYHHGGHAANYSV